MSARIAITSSLCLAAMLLLPSSMASSIELTGACLKDAKAQCPGVQPGGGKIRDCLKTHIADFRADLHHVEASERVVAWERWESHRRKLERCYVAP